MKDKIEECITRRRRKLRVGSIVKIILSCYGYAICIILVLAYSTGP